MSGGVYGGDEVGALVFDPGHFSFRCFPCNSPVILLHIHRGLAFTAVLGVQILEKNSKRATRDCSAYSFPQKEFSRAS